MRSAREFALMRFSSRGVIPNMSESNQPMKKRSQIAGITRRSCCHSGHLSASQTPANQPWNRQGTREEYQATAPKKTMELQKVADNIHQRGYQPSRPAVTLGMVGVVLAS